jgi:DMSO/TMAO reductase YedYZ molybdopterin-dependent catalytic subunit
MMIRYALKRGRPYLLAATMLIVLGAFVLGGCVNPGVPGGTPTAPPTTISPPTPVPTAQPASNGEPQLAPLPLDNVEINEYQGEKLGSITNFRENSIKGVQKVNIDSYRLSINGLVENPVQYTYNDAIGSFAHYQKVVTLNCVEGWSVKVLWEGLLLKDMLEKQGISPEANTVIFHAYDGYTTSMPLDFILDNNIMLAYKMNNLIIPPERGYPFQLVAEDKWGYKWIKWVTQIELSNNSDYRGYWEQRGYSNEGDLNKPFFD